MLPWGGESETANGKMTIDYPIKAYVTIVLALKHYNGLLYFKMD